MRPMKIAISLPDPIFEAAERLAEELQIPRSQLYAEALASYLSTNGGAAITARLNEVHGSAAVAIEPALVDAQLRVLDHEAW
jgi:metal-responsive CopG/Arc/MetJ family transcriptional regulator